MVLTLSTLLIMEVQVALITYGVFHMARASLKSKCGIIVAMHMEFASLLIREPSLTYLVALQRPMC